MRFRISALAAACACALAASGSAGAASPWAGVMLGHDGALASSGDVRYVTLPAGTRTAVAKLRVSDGRVLAYASFAGRFGIPTTTIGGPGEGLSHDGSRLVLAEVSPLVELRQASRFLVLSTAKLRRVDSFSLPGEHGFDALSPDMRTLYTIEHLSASELTRYAVRAYDLRARRLLRQPIVDVREPDEEMLGWPVKRATSRDGAWVYTLYRRDAGAPFVHALHASARAAFCLDLPAKAATDEEIWSATLDLSADGRQLVVRVGARRAATIDTVALRVSQ
jgi:hypothetical protein